MILVKEHGYRPENLGFHPDSTIYYVHLGLSWFICKVRDRILPS